MIAALAAALVAESSRAPLLFVLTRPGCYPLELRVEGGRTHRVRVPFGYPCR